MSNTIEFKETIFNDTAYFGDNTNRVDDVMAVPTTGQSSLVRYKIPTGYNATLGCIAVNCDFGALLLQGAYTTAQDGAQIQIRANSTVKFEQKFNWTGLQGYIGGADDYNAENEIMLSGYNMPFDAGTVIDVYVTGKSNVRRMINTELYGVLDDGTIIREETKQAVNGTVATSVPLYTVPAGRILYMQQLVICTRHIDLYSGRGYFVYNGLPVMTFDVSQTEVGGVYGLVFPFYNLPLKESASIGFRMDAFECGNETVAASVYSVESPIVDVDAIAQAVWTRAGRTLT